jgi:hypothetical protein
MSHRIRLLPAFIVIGLAQIARAQTARPDPLYTSLDPKTRQQIETIRDSARAMGLPDEPIHQKALEGIAKKAEPKRIVAAEWLLLANLRVARDSLGTSDVSELLAAHYALLAGVKADELGQFRGASRGRSPAVALSRLTDMIARLGVPRDEAVPTFARLWKGGSTDIELEGLSQRTEQDILSGKNPGQSLANRARELPVRRSPPPDN